VRQYRQVQDLRQATCRQLQPGRKKRKLSFDRQPPAGLHRLSSLKRQRCALRERLLVKSSLLAQLSELDPGVGERPSTLDVPAQSLVGSLGCRRVHRVLPGAFAAQRTMNKSVTSVSR
jgi:ribosomal protein S8E